MQLCITSHLLMYQWLYNVCGNQLEVKIAVPSSLFFARHNIFFSDLKENVTPIISGVVS